MENNNYEEQPVQGTTIDNQSKVVVELNDEKPTPLQWLKAYATLYLINPFTWLTIAAAIIGLICAL